jgi:hypothetical protein
MKNNALILLLLAAFGCESKRNAGHEGSDSGLAKPAVAASNAVNACLSPDSLGLSTHHTRVIAAMFATDRNRGLSTFGFSPPDPSQIRLLSDQETCTKANAAFESVLTKWGASSPVTPVPKSNLFVYRAGNLYIVLFPDWHSDSDISDQFMFFDSHWKYLGDRAQ